jgi:hypothetical protein
LSVVVVAGFSFGAGLEAEFGCCADPAPNAEMAVQSTVSEAEKMRSQERIECISEIGLLVARHPGGETARKDFIPAIWRFKGRSPLSSLELVTKPLRRRPSFRIMNFQSPSPLSSSLPGRGGGGDLAKAA